MHLPPDDINARVGEWFFVTYRQVIAGVACVTTLRDPAQLAARYFLKNPTRLIVVFDCLEDPGIVLEVEWSQIVEVTPTQVEA